MNQKETIQILESKYPGHSFQFIQILNTESAWPSLTLIVDGKKMDSLWNYIAEIANIDSEQDVDSAMNRVLHNIVEEVEQHFKQQEEIWNI